MKFMLKLLYAFLVILAIVLIFATLYYGLYIIELVFVPLFALLSPAAKIIMAILFVIGLNVLAYFASFVWGQRKPWFFWLCFGLTIVAFFMSIIALG